MATHIVSDIDFFLLSCKMYFKSDPNIVIVILYNGVMGSIVDWVNKQPYSVCTVLLLTRVGRIYVLTILYLFLIRKSNGKHDHRIETTKTF